MLPESKDPNNGLNVAVTAMRSIMDGLCSVCRALVADRINIVEKGKNIKYAEESVKDVEELARNCPGE